MYNIYTGIKIIIWDTFILVVSNTLYQFVKIKNNSLKPCLFVSHKVA